MARRLVLLLTLLSTGAASAESLATQGELATLTSLVTASLSADTRLEVLSAADVKEVIAFEGDKQALGCTDDSSCLAEVAGAMGARLVVFSQLGGLGSQLILTLNLFDAHEGRAQGRVVIKASSIEALGEKLDSAVTQLTSSVEVVEGTPTKLVVLEVKAAAGMSASSADAPVEESEPAEPSGMPWMLVGSGVAAGAGALTAGAGVALVALAYQQDGAAAESRTQSDAAKALDARDGLALGAYVAWGVGASLIVAGSGGMVVGLLIGGE
jgi:hypothetical protein